MIQRLLLGPLNAKWKGLAEINAREIWTLAPLLVITLVLGVYPKLALDIINPALNLILNNMGYINLELNFQFNGNISGIALIALAILALILEFVFKE